MSQLAALPGTDVGAALDIAGVFDPRSVGVARYTRSLAAALVDEGVDYRLVGRRDPTRAAHVHLANSSRSLLLQSRRAAAAFLVTVHDVVPRTRALLPVYRVLAYPQVTLLAAAVVVHSAWAAGMLRRHAGQPRRLEVLPHPAPRPPACERADARRALGWPDDCLVAVVPGEVRGIKLVTEALAAVEGLPDWRIALAGRVADRHLAHQAERHGAIVLADPDDLDYGRAIVAADCVLCLRSGSVGETNGPLLDALGAGRAVIATPTGSIPEVAAGAATYCTGDVRSIRAALVDLTVDESRAELEAIAAARGARLTWQASASAHADLFREVLDG